MIKTLVRKYLDRDKAACLTLGLDYDGDTFEGHGVVVGDESYSFTDGKTRYRFTDSNEKDVSTFMRTTGVVFIGNPSCSLYIIDRNEALFTGLDGVTHRYRGISPIHAGAAVSERFVLVKHSRYSTEVNPLGFILQEVYVEPSWLTRWLTTWVNN